MTTDNNEDIQQSGARFQGKCRNCGKQGHKQGKQLLAQRREEEQKNSRIQDSKQNG